MTETKNKKIGLALSGGGYRAAAFHLGVLRKLKALKIIDKVDVISTISGGSIAGVYYALNQNDFQKFEKQFRGCLQKSVMKIIIFDIGFWLPSLILIGAISFLIIDPFNFPAWLTSVILTSIILVIFIFQFKIVSMTKLKIKAYKKIFFANKTLTDLPDSPVIAINTTNLATGTLWTFSKKKSSDSSYEYPKDGSEKVLFNCDKFPIAMAVAASTSVPIPFNPISINKKYFQKEEDSKRIKPCLIDGGLYDNQGIHKITQKNSSYVCDIIIVSDGSQPFKNKCRVWNSGLVLYRGIDVMMRKIKNLQFIRDVFSEDKEIAYFSLDWRYQRSVTEFVKSIRNGHISTSVLLFHELDKELLLKHDNELITYISKKIDLQRILKSSLSEKEIEEISCIPTNLTALSERQIDLLVRHGETLADIYIKLHCPGLLNFNTFSGMAI
ncbi:MAG TPA: patatin-like phospholipase family protein [Bacteroidia bacterium]|nr:patatin-like phospholipase family protein [Bacteroidia bacterium]